MNYFEKYPGQILVALYDMDGSTDIAPIGPRCAENLIRASQLARDWSTQSGIISTAVWSPDEELISEFQDGVLQPLVENPRAGIQ